MLKKSGLDTRFQFQENELRLFTQDYLSRSKK